ncbi:zinc ribbon domain-containing protein [Rhodoferax sp. WC2427]|uniref:FmdB family zinc ribbon protein n=1 Tax=Rhodoferax sp. WC2427 TaxID=3234144 RepID=UPI0034657D01
MPTYDYVCPACGGFEAIRRLAERDDPCACPVCGNAAQRVLTLSTAEPRRASSAHGQSLEANYQRLKHRAGCACC